MIRDGASSMIFKDSSSPLHRNKEFIHRPSISLCRGRYSRFPQGVVTKLLCFHVGKSKDRPKVGRPDRTEIVGPKKWAGPVSVQLRSGPRQAFGLGPKGEICPSLLPSTSAWKNPMILFGYCRHTLNPHSKSLQASSKSKFRWRTAMFFIKGSALKRLFNESWASTLIRAAEENSSTGGG